MKLQKRKSQISKYDFIAFILAAISIYVILRCRGFCGGGRYSIVAGDSLHNYIPAIYSFLRSILNGESIYYSWNICMGMNTSLYYAYYAINPFNILFLLGDFWGDNAVTILIIVIKVGISAFCFNRFLTNVVGYNDARSLIFSLFYALCSFQVISNVINIAWLDAMFVLPMVFVAIEELKSTKRIKPLVFWYSYIFITQFYMGYMIAIISALYFTLYLLLNAWNNGTTSVREHGRRYLTATFLSVGISSFVWIPALMFIIHNGSGSVASQTYININLRDIIRQLYWGELAGLNATVPNLYAGILVVLLLPCFFFSKKIDNTYKVIYGLLLVAFIGSCLCKPLYIMWHGFDSPDGWTFRFSYLICFILCAVAAMAYKNIGVSERRILILSVLTELILYIFIEFCGRETGDYSNLVANTIIFLTWYIVTELYIRVPFNRIIPCFMIGITILECILLYSKLPSTGVLKSQYDIWDLTTSESMKVLSKSDSFYRVKYNNEYSICAGAKYGYKAISYFSSAENQRVRNTLGKLGIYTTPRVVLNLGLTPITEMILGVKYTVDGVVLEEGITADELFANITENERSLGVGYLVGKGILDWGINNDDAFDNSNRLLSVMTDTEIAPFIRIPNEDIYIEENGIKMYCDGNGYELMLDHEYGSEDSSIEFVVKSNNDNPVFAYISNYVSQSLVNYFEIEAGGNELLRKSLLSVSTIYELKEKAGDHFLTIMPTGKSGVQSFNDIEFVSYDEEELNKAHEKLKTHQLSVDECKNGYLKGTINISGDGRVLFLTIPYDSGWMLKVDGIRQEILPVLNNTFMAVDLHEDGKHEIELEYKAPGALAGILMSCVSLLILCIMSRERVKT